MHSIDWSKLKLVIETGNEEPKIDLKTMIDLSENSGKSEFAKDVVSIANTDGPEGYLIIGVTDAKERSANMPLKKWLVGFSAPDADKLQQQMNQSIVKYITPPFGIHYRQELYPDTSIELGIVIIPRSRQRPHLVNREGEKIKKGQIWVRRGADKVCASREEVLDMCSDHYSRICDREKRDLWNHLKDIQDEANTYRLLSRQASQQLYEIYSEQGTQYANEELWVLLNFFDRGEMFEEWFGGE